MERQAFIDWMKATGMLLIVTGHVFGSPYNLFNLLSQPVYTKQLGVAFFIFIIGWGLANEKRDAVRVVFNRVFPVYFYGILFTLLLTLVYFAIGHDLNPSNILPFIGGINVLLNYFPANTTTWYIGTYLHLLLFWFFFLRGKDIGKKQLIIAFIFESLFRFLILALGKNYTAYMLLPNWLTVFLLGMYLHDKRDTTWNPKTIWLLLIWVCILTFWASAYNLLHFNTAFPFRLSVDTAFLPLPLFSALISLVYLINTWAVFELFRRLPSVRLISFFARNTLIIFIVHIPIIFTCSHYFYSLFDGAWIKRLVWIAVLYIGLALISELVCKSINIIAIREKVFTSLQKILPIKIAE